MGLYAGVCLVFGFDVAKFAHPSDIYEIVEESDTVECTSAGDGEHVVLYARGSYLSLLSHKTVEVHVLDVERQAATFDAAPMENALRTFCEAHAIPWQEPRWLIVSDVS